MVAVGVVGLGLMGGSMAARLVDEGHDVIGFDVDAKMRERAEGDGVRTVRTIAELASEPSVILTSLPNSAIVREVWLGSGGLVDSMQDGSVVLEVSTIDPQTMKTIAAAVPAGVAVIDAPVSGGPVEARSGRLTFLLGGDESDIERAAPVLSSLASAIHHAGSIGTGKIVKIANNVMSAANIVVAAEAFEAAVAAGMEPRRLFEILSTSGGASSQFVKRFPWVLEGDFEPRFTVALAAKDLGLALDMARSVGVPAPMTSAAREMYQVAIGQGKSLADMVVVADLYRKWAVN